MASGSLFAEERTRSSIPVRRGRSQDCANRERIEDKKGFRPTNSIRPQRSESRVQVSLTVANIGASILRPLILSQLSKRVPAGKQGLVMGVNQSIYSVCAILAPLISGALINRAFYSSWAWLIALLGSVGLLIALALKPNSTEDCHSF